MMNQTQHYVAILEIHKKQKTLLEEIQRQLNQHHLKYEDARNNLVERIQPDFDDDSFKLNQDEQKLTVNMKCVSGICEESSLIWEKVKQKLSAISGFRAKINSVSENQIDILQEVDKDLRQFDNAHQSEKISREIEDYRNKTANLNELVADILCLEYQLDKVAETSDYEIPFNVKSTRKTYKRQGLTKILAQIKEAKKNIQTINFKTKEELEKQL